MNRQLGETLTSLPPNTSGGKWNDCFGVEQLSKIHTLIFKLYWFLYTFFQPEDISNWVYWISYWITLILGRAEVKQSVRAGSIAKGRFVVLPSLHCTSRLRRHTYFVVSDGNWEGVSVWESPIGRDRGVMGEKPTFSEVSIKPKNVFLFIYANFSILASHPSSGAVLSQTQYAGCKLGREEFWAEILKPNFSLFRYFLVSFVSVWDYVVWING